MPTYRFATRNFKGTPVQYFLVESEDIGQAAPVAIKKPSHHVIILDRSGSMYSDLSSLKGTLEKLLTLAEFNDDTQRISLISYSSSGDVKLHFAKVTVGDVMATNSPYLQELRSIQVTGMTCISQSLTMAETLVDDNETTCISLHTDGYANDRSPSQESRDIQVAVDRLKKHPALFVNTLAYNNYCDFNLMASIANQLSGKCLQVKGIKEVYQALYDTQALLNGGTSPAITADIGKANYVVFLSRSAGKVLGSTGSIQVKGLKDTDDKTAYRFTAVDAATYDASGVPNLDTGIVLAYARAMIAEGNINAAKYALVTARIPHLLKTHYRALVPADVAEMAAAVEQVVFSTDVYAETDAYGLGESKATVLDVLGVLDTYKSSVRVNVEELGKVYKRRGLKKVAGVRKEDGTLVPPVVTTIDRNPNAYLPLASVDVNRNTATVNILLVKPVRLVKDLVKTEHGETYTPVDEVAGIALDGLKDFKNYTIVGDGVVCTPVLQCKISDQRCFKALTDLGVVTGDFNPLAYVELNLGELPVVDFDKSFKVDAADLETLARLTVLSKILSATVKESSDSYTAEQLAALKEVYLSGALYFSPPTTNDYTDLSEALATGKVDTRLSYKVNLGLPKITDLSKIPSANAFLERRFTLTVDGAEVAKPKMTEFLNPKAVWAVKALGPKVKLTAIDELCFPIFASMLGFGSSAGSWIHIGSILESAGANFSLQGQVQAVIAHTITGDEAVQILTTARKAVDDAIEGIYAKTVSPLVFFVGATGLVPDEFGCKALTAEAIEAKYPDITLSKDEKEGTFYVLPGDVLMTVFTKGEYFTVTAPVQQAA